MTRIHRRSAPGRDVAFIGRASSRLGALLRLALRYSARVTCPHKPISASTAWA